MSPPDRAVRLPYMPGLDGLRALAVSGVLLYHGGARWLPGGFLGVDVFFALSGYLITSLLLAEFTHGQHVNLRRFWGARARRLLPAALLVIFTTLLVIAVFEPGELASARGDAIASTFYVNNWHQIAAQRSYFAAFGRPSLFQHLWSLAVEEQFYLVWPLLLAAAMARLARRTTVLLTAGLAGASILAMALVYDGHGDASRVYYGSDTRAFSLLAGALLAFAWGPARARDMTARRTVTAIDGLGLVAIGALAAIMLSWHDSDAALYPAGLVAVAGVAVAIVAAVAHPETWTGRLLGLAPLRWIGQRSYGIYLWHWPVMTLSRPGLDLHGDRTLIVAGQIAVTLLLATVSYRFLEMPVRRGTFVSGLRARLEQRAPRERLRFAAIATTAALAALLFPFLRSAPPEQAGARGLPLATAASRHPPKIAGSAASRSADHRPPLAVGASVMLGAAPALAAVLGSGAQVDAAVGRQPRDVVARLKAYAAEGALPGRVIVQIGENGPLSDDDVRSLRGVLSPVRRVVLLNVRIPRSWEASTNRTLAALARSWPQARLADWYAASSVPGRLYDDHTHPNPAGEAAYARIVERALQAP